MFVNLKYTVAFLFSGLISFSAASGCADAVMDQHSVTFINNCNYAVYWTVECATPGAGCFGFGRVTLKSGESITKGYVAVIIYGPYKN